jgi:hypothetical protein
MVNLNTGIHTPSKVLQTFKTTMSVIMQPLGLSCKDGPLNGVGRRPVANIFNILRLRATQHMQSEVLHYILSQTCTASCKLCYSLLLEIHDSKHRLLASGKPESDERTHPQQGNMQFP